MCEVIFTMICSLILLEVTPLSIISLPISVAESHKMFSHYFFLSICTGKQSQGVWLGAKANSDREWTWNGLVTSPVVYTDWLPGKPNNQFPPEDCLCNMEAPGWDDCPCNWSLPYVCEKRGKQQ